MAVRVKREPGPTLSSDSPLSGGGGGGGQHRVCYVCGGQGGAFSLYSRPRDRGSYFPFLEQHEIPYGADRPTDDGLVLSCMLCYSLLGQQWESFERNRTPHAKRLYWLKRADNGHYLGAEMRLQGEYAAQMIGVSPDAGLVPSSSNSHSHYGGSSGSPAVRQHVSTSAREPPPGNGGGHSHHQQPSSADQHRLPQSSRTNEGSYYVTTRDGGPGSRSSSVVMAPASSYPPGPSPHHPHIQQQHHIRDLEREQQEVTASVLLDLRSGAGPVAVTKASSSIGGGTPCASPRSFKSRGGDPGSESRLDVVPAAVASTPANGVLDLSMPDKNEKSEACYLCGSEVLRSDLVNVYAKPVANCPFFPSLMMHPRQSHSRPMDYSGCVQACVSCHQHLLQQWDVFQRKNVPHSERRYQLRKLSSAAGPPPPLRAPPPHPPSSPPPPPTQTHPNSSPPPQPPDEFICFLCGQEFAWSMRHFLYVGPNPEGEPPLPFLERVKPSRGALPLSATGRGLACASCHRAIHHQRHAYQGISGEADSNRERSQPPPQQHQPRAHTSSKIAAVESRADSNGATAAPPLPPPPPSDRPVLLSCQACRRPIQRGHLKVIDFLPHREPGRPFHPYTADGESGGVPVCSACFSIYVAQWEAYEEEGIPQPHRRYVLTAPQPRRHPTNQDSVSPPPPPPPQPSYRPIDGGSYTPSGGSLHTDVGLRIRVPSPAEHDYSPGIQHHQQSLLTTVSSVSSSPVSTISVGQPAPAPSNALDLTGCAGGRSTRSNVSSPTSCVQPRSSMPSQGSSTRGSFVCYVCGLRSRGSERPYAVRTYPPPKSATDDAAGTAAVVPFFPSLTLHATPPEASPAAEDGTVVTCVFCFHALLLQWSAYELSPRRPADRNPWSRAYDCHDFVCYICGVTTYRKRVRRISVADFPFLVEHPRPPGALVLDGGDGVAVCLMCSDTLSAQWNDFERMKMPLELRKYNWIAAPPPPEDERRHSSPPPVPPTNDAQHALGNQDSMPNHHPHCLTDDEQQHIGFPSSRRAIASQDPSSRQSSMGLPHGSKPIPPLTGTLSSVSNGTALKPTPHHSNASSNVPPLNQVSPGAHHGNAKSSSFAAALRKLAEQATDPVDKDLSPVSSVSPPCPASGPKRAPPPLILSSDMHHPVVSSSLSLASNFASPPPAMVANSQSHLIYSDGRKSLDHSLALHNRSHRHDVYDDHSTSDSRHGERDRDVDDVGSVERHGASSRTAAGSPPPPPYGERESDLQRRLTAGYLRGQQLPSHPHSVGEFSPVDKAGGGADGGSNTTHSMTYGERGREELRYSTANGLLSSQPLPHVRLHPQSLSSNLPSRLDEHYVTAGSSSSSSFQPYRCADESQSRMPAHVTSPYEGATTAFGYHPSAFMSHPLPQPPFRLEEHMYLERYGLLRPPMFPVAHHHGVLPPSHHALPFMTGSTRYAPDLMQHQLGLVSPPVNHLMVQERIKLEDADQQHRRDFFHDSAERRSTERKPSSSDGAGGVPSDRERKQKSPWSGHGRMSESPVHSASGIGSIMQGTPRDMVVQHKGGPAPSWAGSSSSPPPGASGTSSGQSHSYGGRHASRHSSDANDHQHHRRSAGQTNSSSAAKSHYNALIAGPDRPSYSTDTADASYRSRLPGDYGAESRPPMPGLSSTSKSPNASAPGHHHHNQHHHARSASTGSRGTSAFHHVSSLAPGADGGWHGDSKSPTWDMANGPREFENGLRHEFFVDPRSARDSGPANHRVASWPTTDGRLPSDAVAARTPAGPAAASVHRSLYHERRREGSAEPEEEPRRRTFVDVEVSWCATSADRAESPRPSDGRSKLDLAEERHARLGPDVTSESSCDEEDDNKETGGGELSSRYSRLLDITKGPPLPLDLSKEKLSFMETVGLITQQRKRVLEANKFLKRHRMLRGLCVPPPDPLSQDVSPTTPWYLMSDDAESNGEEKLSPAADPDQKVKYMESLNLREVSETQRNEFKEIISAVIEEKLRRNGYPVCDRNNGHQHTSDDCCPDSSDTEANDVVDRGTKRKLSECGVDDSPMSTNDNPSKRFAPGTLLNDLSDPEFSPASRPSATKSASPSGTHRQTPELSNRSTPAGMLKCPTSNARDFAQEFHEAVLQQTQLHTSRPSSKSAGPLSVDSETTLTRDSELQDDDRRRRTSEVGGHSSGSPPSVQHSSGRNRHHDQTVRWPGVEALMVAYERHREEHKLEHNVLQEHCLRLKRRNQELSSAAESLRLRMADLFNIKKDLDGDRQNHQQVIDGLKGFLKQLR